MSVLAIAMSRPSVRSGFADQDHDDGPGVEWAVAQAGRAPDVLGATAAAGTVTVIGSRTAAAALWARLASRAPFSAARPRLPVRGGVSAKTAALARILVVTVMRSGSPRHALPAASGRQDIAAAGGDLGERRVLARVDDEERGREACPPRLRVRREGDGPDLDGRQRCLVHEVAQLRTHDLRSADRTAQDRHVLLYTPAEWRAFVGGFKRGEFDLT
jgi:hypothetical protein